MRTYDLLRCPQIPLRPMNRGRRIRRPAQASDTAKPADTLIRHLSASEEFFGRDLRGSL